MARRRTFTFRTNFISFARNTASTTAFEVGFEIDAISTTIGESFLAGNFAIALGTNLTVCASITTFSAVIAVRLNINTRACTVGGSSDTVRLTQAFSAKFVFFTSIITATTVLGVRLHIHTSSSAFCFIIGAFELTFTIGTNFVRAHIALISTGSTVIRVGGKFNACVAA